MLAGIPMFPSGRCCYRNRSSSQRGRVVPAGGCPVEEHTSSLKHKVVTKSLLMMQYYKLKAYKTSKLLIKSIIGPSDITTGEYPINSLCVHFVY